MMVILMSKGAQSNLDIQDFDLQWNLDFKHVPRLQAVHKAHRRKIEIYRIYEEEDKKINQLKFSLSICARWKEIDF